MVKIIGSEVRERRPGSSIGEQQRGLSVRSGPVNEAVYIRCYWRLKADQDEGAGLPCKRGGTGTSVVLRGTLVQAFGRLDGGDGSVI